MIDKSKYLVNISNDTLERIFQTISHSNVEEGGKLVGTIHNYQDCTEITVQSYIDSGIKVDKSPTHLLPDWNYQEKVFKTLELFDDNIFHIGTWHSHHCNGLKTLSNGDIRGYYSDVNNPNYIVDNFLAILVTDICSNNMSLKYFLFVKGENSFIEVEGKNIRKVSVHNKSIELLKFINTLSNSLINNSPRREDQQSSDVTNTSTTLREFRALDDQWLKNNFEKIITKRNCISNVISWQWKFKSDGKVFQFNYYHPPYLKKYKSYSCLKVYTNQHMVRKEKICIDSERHSKINEIVRKYVK